MSIPIQPDMENHKLHETLEIVAITLDVIGLIGCLVMFIAIIAYQSYRTTKDRIILGVCVISILFVALGNMPEKSMRVQDMYVPRAKWNIFFEFSTWWATLFLESALLAYSCGLLLTIRSGSALKPQSISLTLEVVILLVIVSLACVAGAVSLHGVESVCPSTADSVSYYDPSGSCYAAQATINFVWMGFLLVPCVIQFSIWYTLRKAYRVAAMFDDLTARGETIEDPDIALAPALLRIIKTVVKPLQWYPVVFLITSVLYVVWIIATHTREEHKKWAHVASPASNLVFSTKGITTAAVFFFSQDFRQRERGMVDQIRYRLQNESVRAIGNPYMNELLLPESSSNDSTHQGGGGGGGGGWTSLSRSTMSRSRYPSTSG